MSAEKNSEIRAEIKCLHRQNIIFNAIYCQCRELVTDQQKDEIIARAISAIQHQKTDSVVKRNADKSFTTILEYDIIRSISKSQEINKSNNI